MLGELAGHTHAVLSGLCLLGDGFAVVEHEVTLVTFRAVADAELEIYLDSAEWEGRAGGYAIQGLGARLVARIDGDYLNVVGLPGALLIEKLAAHAPNLLQIRS
jgi:septum formation protein